MGRRWGHDPVTNNTQKTVSQLQLEVLCVCVVIESH